MDGRKIARVSEVHFYWIKHFHTTINKHHSYFLLIRHLCAVHWMLDTATRRSEVELLTLNSINSQQSSSVIWHLWQPRNWIELFNENITAPYVSPDTLKAAASSLKYSCFKKLVRFPKFLTRKCWKTRLWHAQMPVAGQTLSNAVISSDGHRFIITRSSCCPHENSSSFISLYTEDTVW